jgi:sulfate adenylyltransferase subunit 1 (EFTu-like GTPase family)
VHPASRRRWGATLCGLGDAPLHGGSRLLVKHGTRVVRARITEVSARLDLTAVAWTPATGTLALNEIAKARLTLAEPIAFDSFVDARETGAFILIDEHTNDTVGAGLID